LLAQICIKSFVGWGFAPDLTGGAYSVPPDLLAGLGGRAPGKGKEGGERERREGTGREARGREGGVPECPNSELGSLMTLDLLTLHYRNYNVHDSTKWTAASRPMVNSSPVMDYRRIGGNIIDIQYCTSI